MEANIAVATVSGKAYYLIVNELRKRGMQFLSIMPNEPIPIEIRVVVTTEKEKHLINHGKILVYEDKADVETLISSVVQIAQGKEYYDRLVIGVDPGEAIGLAVLADGKVIEAESCSSVRETLEKVKNILKRFENTRIASVTVKIGDGAPAYKEELLIALDNSLPQSVLLESVSEAGTSHYESEFKNRRGLRDIVSATKIAGRNGHAFLRRKRNESDS